MSNYELLGVGTNAKTIKGDGSEYLTAILYMTPYKVMVDGKLFNSCSMAAMASCIEGCLYTAGRGRMYTVQTARQRKAEWFYRDRVGFMKQLYHDIQKFSNYCKKRGIQPCVRLNGTTDILWELIPAMPHNKMNIFQEFPEVQFYDYTKIPNRKVADYPNYHLTWSYSAANPKYEELFWDVIRKGMSVAVVFRKPVNMTTWRGYKVVDGDKDDLRFLDPQSSIVALYAKGAAKHDSTGFVQDI